MVDDDVVVVLTWSMVAKEMGRDTGRIENVGKKTGVGKLDVLG
jgi:hypothetical protein